MLSFFDYPLNPKFMTPNTFSVHFIIRNDRMDKEGYVPIYAKITINGERLSMALNYRIKASNWLAKAEQAKANTSNSKEINLAIEAMKSRIYQAHSFLLATAKALTAEELKLQIFGEQAPKVPTLLELTRQHNEQFEKMVGIKYSYGSLKNYKTSLRFLTEYIPTYNNKKDIPLKDVNYKFAEAFYHFLTTQKTSKQNGANKHIQRLKKIINYAVKLDYLPKNTLESFSLEFSPVNKVALTMDEIKRLQKLNLQRATLRNVRDIFLLQCFTGLSYGDVERLTLSDIHEVTEGEYWIKMEREKTQVHFSVPLLAPALEILESFWEKESGEKLLPILTNQKMNENLKIIQELASINKSLTTHLARHTFATAITLANGVPIETVSRMLGHTKLSTTQVYAKVLEEKIGRCKYPYSAGSLKLEKCN
jgi:site-specific recombinase XerD